MKTITALIAGILFGWGLIISGMSNPAKVIGFLDITGNWDPSLAFVMAGAISVGAIGFQFAKKSPTTLIAPYTTIQHPTKSTIDWQLIVGSLLFGIGWGLAGICPGPALTLAGMGLEQGAIFVVAMLAGMLVFHFYQKGSS